MLQDLVDAIEKLIDSHLNELHTAIPAEIIEFDAKKCTASVKPWGKLVLTNGSAMTYPQLNDVPVMFPRGGGQDAVIVYPVKKGDGCLLIISEQALDYWRSSGVQNSEMKYSLTNAVAIPGLFANPVGDVEEAVKTDSIIIRNGNAYIKMSRSNITIRGDVEVEGNLTTSKKITGLQGVYTDAGGTDR